MRHHHPELSILVLLFSVAAFCGADEGPPRIVPHRGLLRHASENALANFRACLGLRFGFEFDVQRTKDGRLVCIHDDTVERPTNGAGNVSQLTLAQIRGFDAGGGFGTEFQGEKVPTVDEAFALNLRAAMRDVSATFSIIAVDPENGVCGAAVASKYPAVGNVVPYVRPGVGAFCTQHHHVPKWGKPALDMLEQGRRPDAVLFELLKDDKDADLRQLAIVDMQGRVAVHNPTRAGPGSRYWGAMSGRYYSCQGNTLTGREVIVAMSTAYETTEGSLADRLMAALVAGDRAGGDHRGRLAAGIRVAKKGIEGDWLSLHVDMSDDAVTELARKYAELKHEAKGAEADGTAAVSLSAVPLSAMFSAAGVKKEEFALGTGETDPILPPRTRIALLLLFDKKLCWLDFGNRAVPPGAGSPAPE